MEPIDKTELDHAIGSAIIRMVCSNTARVHQPDLHSSLVRIFGSNSELSIPISRSLTFVYNDGEDESIELDRVNSITVNGRSVHLVTDRGRVAVMENSPSPMVLMY